MRLSKKITRAVTLCMALALIVCGIAVMPASAGKAGGYVVSSSMFATETLSQAEWKFDDTGVTLVDGALVFDEFYDIENPVLSRTAAHVSDEIKLALEIRYNLTIEEIKGTKQFGLGFGIRRLDRDITEEGAAFLYAQETDKGIGFGLSTVKGGEVVHLKELTHFASSVKNLAVTVRISNAGAVTVLLGSSVFYSGEAGEVTAEGYLGFSSDGGWSTDDNYVKASISNMVAYNEYYAKPETPLMVVADFDTNEFNVNEWAYNSTTISGGSGLIVQNGHLRFDGTGQNSAIAAQFKYSNFELQYEIFDMKNTLTTSSGRLIAPSIWQQIAWGDNAASAYSVAAQYNMPYALIFETGLDTNPDSPTYLQRTGGLSVHFYKDNAWQGAFGIPTKYAFNSPTFDPETRVQIRLVNMDGKATLYMKLQSETEWTQIWTYTYENGIMPLGYVAIRGEGNQFTSTNALYAHGAWYSIDNILLKNYDKNPTLITVSFESNRIPPMPDYDYKDPYVDSYLIDYTGGKP